MGTRVRGVGFVLVGCVLACSGDDAPPEGAGTGISSGGNAGAAGSGSLEIGGRAGAGGGLGGGAGSGGGAGIAGLGGVAGSGGSTTPGRVSTVAAGDDQTCALSATGEVHCWGYRGDLPVQSTDDVVVAPSPAVGLPLMQTLVGHRHFCALTKETRALHCWGGDAPGVDVSKPNAVQTALDVGGPVDDVAVASLTTCVRQGAVVSCFGQSAVSGAGASGERQGKMPVFGVDDALSLVGNGGHFCARRPAVDGGVKATCWGKGLPLPKDVPGETSVADIAITAEGDVLVRRMDGSVGSARVMPDAEGGFSPSDTLKVPSVDAVVADRTLCVVRSSDKKILCALLEDRMPATRTEFLVEIQGLDAPPVELSTNASHTMYGLDTSCARTASGKLFCWGVDRWAQSGVGTVDWELEPSVVPNIEKAARVAVGDLGSAAVLEDGTAVEWGSAKAFGHHIPASTSALSPTPLPGPADQMMDLQFGADDEQVYGVRTNGGALYAVEHGDAATGTGLQAFPGASSFLPGVVRQRGFDYGVASFSGQTSLVFFVNDVKSEANTELGALGIFANGGFPAQSQYSSVALSNLVGFAHGSFHGLAWDKDGSLYCWGGGSAARCGQPPDQKKNVTSPTKMSLPGETIASACGGWATTCAATQSGKVYCWGAPGLGLGGISDGGGPADGQVPDKKNLPDNEPMKGIACGPYTACAWSDSKVYCWGENDTAQLGLGNRQNQKQPALVPSLAGAKHMALGAEHTCAVTMTGQVACWGSPMGGRLGNGQLGYSPNVARPVVGLP